MSMEFPQALGEIADIIRKYEAEHGSGTLGCIVQSESDDWYEWNGDIMEPRTAESIGRAILNED